jgi:hypothetical protein
MAKTEEELLRALEDPPEGFGRDPEADYSHGHLIDLLGAFGFENGDDRGACYGVSSALNYAVIRKNLNTFRKEMEIIAHMDANPESIQWYKNLLLTDDPTKVEAKRRFIHVLARLEGCARRRYEFGQ